MSSVPESPRGQPATSHRAPPRERGRVHGTAAVPSAHPDEVLVIRAREGERWAQEALFRRYVGPITALVTPMVGREQDADDAVQDAFFEALSTLDRLRDPGAFRGWLHRIALNRARKILRRRRLMRLFGYDHTYDFAALSMFATPETDPETLVELRRLEAVLARLNPEERMAWMLRHVNGESMETIAEWLDVSVATAKRRVCAAEVKIGAYIAGRSR